MPQAARRANPACDGHLGFADDPGDGQPVAAEVGARAEALKILEHVLGYLAATSVVRINRSQLPSTPNWVRQIARSSSGCPSTPGVLDEGVIVSRADRVGSVTAHGERMIMEGRLTRV